MAIANYTDLQSAVADYLARSDLTARIPDFITLAEAHFNRELRTHEMMIGASLTLSGGAAVIPADVLEWVSASWVGARTRDLKYCEPDSEEWRFKYRPNGDPAMFSIFRNVVTTRPAGTGTLSFTYYQSIPSLNPGFTNWLLTKSPDLYIYRTLAEAYIYQKNDTRAAEFLALSEAEVKKEVGSADSNKLAQRPTAKPPGDDTGTA